MAMQAPYVKAAGEAAGAVDLPPAYFDGKVNEAVLHQVVKAHLANRRRGAAAKKNRAAVAGGSRKPWRQKGTGRARQGTIRAVQWRGGGRAFPPRPRSWAERVPKRVKALAKRSAFNSRAADGRLVVIERWDFDTPKTRALRTLLAKLDVPGRVLLLTKGVHRELYLSSRNLPSARVVPFGMESAYDIVRASAVVLEESVLAGFAADAGVHAGPASAEPIPSDEEPALSRDAASSAGARSDAAARDENAASSAERADGAAE